MVYISTLIIFNLKELIPIVTKTRPTLSGVHTHGFYSVCKVSPRRQSECCRNTPSIIEVKCLLF